MATPANSASTISDAQALFRQLGDTKLSEEQKKIFEALGTKLESLYSTLAGHEVILQVIGNAMAGRINAVGQTAILKKVSLPGKHLEKGNTDAAFNYVNGNIRVAEMEIKRTAEKIADQNSLNFSLTNPMGLQNTLKDLRETLNVCKRYRDDFEAAIKSNQHIVFTKKDESYINEIACPNQDKYDEMIKFREGGGGTIEIGGKKLSMDSKTRIVLAPTALERFEKGISVVEKDRKEAMSFYNHRDSAGNTPLMLRCQNFRSDANTKKFIDAVCDAGADVNAVNAQGESAAHILAKNAPATDIVATLVTLFRHGCTSVEDERVTSRLNQGQRDQLKQSLASVREAVRAGIKAGTEAAGSPLIDDLINEAAGFVVSPEQKVAHDNRQAGGPGGPGAES